MSSAVVKHDPRPHGELQDADEETSRAAKVKGHLIVCGADRLAIRVTEELRAMGEAVAYVATPMEASIRRRAENLGANPLEGSHREEEILLQAGVENAKVIIVAEGDDAGNLEAALVARELNPSIRIILRVFSRDLGERAEQVLDNCVALSSSSIAAPNFVAAALEEDGEQRFTVAGRHMVARYGVAAPDTMLALALGPDGGDALFPTVAQGEGLLLEAEHEQRREAERRVRLRRERFSALTDSLTKATATIIDIRTRVLSALVIVIIIISTFIIHVYTHLNVLDSVYFVNTTVMTIGCGGITPYSSHWSSQLEVFTMVLQVLGVIAVACVSGVIVDAIVTDRLRRALGTLNPHIKGHAVVIGLGSIGFRVASEIQERGFPVVVAELRDGGRYNPLARHKSIPVVTGDARLSETLAALRVEKARWLLAVTEDDMANLEVSLLARAHAPHIKVVNRLFDPALAGRIERTFGVHVARSGSALAAPAFVAAALGGKVQATMQAGNRIVTIAEVDAKAGSALVGMTPAMLHAGEVRVLARRLQGTEWNWGVAHDGPFQPGETLAMAASREALGDLLRMAQPPAV